MDQMIEDFTPIIINWYEKNKRDLPWRETKDPYFIWISEIILQQTRVNQGLPYYYKFIDRFPSIQHFAKASEDEILSTWKGLGYYSRARNMHATAKHLVENFQGTFPNKYDELIKLKGIGNYTASAIASFCFNEITPVIDGNVVRVISRVYGINGNVDNTDFKKKIFNVVSKHILTDNPAQFNQAIMEFGALQCVPTNPNCSICPFQKSCIAYGLNKVKNYPPKKQKINKKHRYFEYVIMEHGSKIFLKKRAKKDIWNGLYEPYLMEYQTQKDDDEVKNHVVDWVSVFSKNFKIYNPSDIIKHVLSHQLLHIRFWPIQIEAIHTKTSDIKEGTWIEKNELELLGLPVVIQKYLSNQ